MPISSSTIVSTEMINRAKAEAEAALADRESRDVVLRSRAHVDALVTARARQAAEVTAATSAAKEGGALVADIEQRFAVADQNLAHALVAHTGALVGLLEAVATHNDIVADARREMAAAGLYANVHGTQFDSGATPDRDGVKVGKSARGPLDAGIVGALAVHMVAAKALPRQSSLEILLANVARVSKSRPEGRVVNAIVEDNQRTTK